MTPTVYFKMKGYTYKCECGEYEVDMLVPTEQKKQEMLEHARTHNALTISIVEEF